MPCSWCFRRNLACRMAAGSSRCSECVRRGRSCDGSSVASALTKLMSEQKRVEEEEADAEETLFVLQTQLQTAVGRLARLRRQKRFLKERGSELFRRGVQSLEELEEEDRRLEASEARVTADIQSFGIPDPSTDWSAFSLSFSEVDLAALSAQPVVAPGFVRPSLGHESSADIGPSFSPSSGVLAGPPGVDQGSSGGTPPVSQGSGGS
ncbi:hypothetical protein N658DRAFT_502222 [Parathielavia hyrcaniae]|uniref:Uncharacterized protein n=1 Tax=Parathielavia hyrcaniae TaxID=113614 RepID=A0AAN6PRV7_9PEZI|nr:hypothetical protein N658DRAFT_502222 [Parathielavia hyrcaniae]